MKFLKITKKYSLGVTFAWDTSRWYINPSLQYERGAALKVVDTKAVFIWLRWLVAGAAMVIAKSEDVTPVAVKAEAALTTKKTTSKVTAKTASKTTTKKSK